MRLDKTLSSDIAFFGFLLGLLVLSAGGHIVSGDEETMFRVTQNIINRKGLSIQREMISLPEQRRYPFIPTRTELIWTTSAVQGLEGETYSKYGIGQSIFVLPLFYFGHAWESILDFINVYVSQGTIVRQVVSIYNSIVLAGIGWLVLRFGRSLGYKTSTCRWLAVAVIFSSMAWPYVKTFYPQPSVAFLFLLAVYSAFQWLQGHRYRWLVILSVACSVAILFRLDAVIIIPALVIYLTLKAPVKMRWKWVIPLSSSLGIALGLTGLYNLYRFGSIANTGYTEVAWSTPPFLGLYGLLVSPGKGVIFYAPMLLLIIPAGITFSTRFRSETLLIIGIWLSVLGLYATYNFWTGGFNWGPRFLLPVIPLGYLPLGELLEGHRNHIYGLFFGVFFLLGLVIQAPAVIVDHSRYLNQQLSKNDDPQAYNQTIYSFAHSPMVKQWPIALELISAYRSEEIWASAADSIDMIKAQKSDIQNGESLLVAEFLRLNTLDFWWLNGKLVDSKHPGPGFVIIPWLVLIFVSGMILLVTDEKHA